MSGNGASAKGAAASAASPECIRPSVTSSHHNVSAVTMLMSTSVSRSANTLGPSTTKIGAINHDSTASMYSWP